jgi:cyclic beta-1,2-glucan synthetase
VRATRLVGGEAPGGVSSTCCATNCCRTPTATCCARRRGSRSRPARAPCPSTCSGRRAPAGAGARGAASASSADRCRSPAQVELEQFNGLGGFAADGPSTWSCSGRASGRRRPGSTSWPTQEFGFQVSAWARATRGRSNSRENKLTPWSNDPVSDRPARCSTSATRTPGSCGARPRCPSARRTPPTSSATGRATPSSSTSPTGSPSAWSSSCPRRGRVKISRLRLENRSARRTRTCRSRPTSSGCWACPAPRRRRTWSPSTTSSDRCHLRPQRLERGVRGAGRVRRPGRAQTSWTADRLEFLGRNATLDHPCRRNGCEAVGTDRCGPGPLRRPVHVGPARARRAHVEVVFLLGEADTARRPGS